MVRTNLQEFVGDVHVLSNLQVGSNLFANDLAANVLTVIGSIGANIFIGDGGLLSNIATTLNDIVANPGGNTVSNTLVFESGADATSNTAIATLSNVGISISNTEPSGEFQFAVGSNIFVNTHASNVLTVVGAIGSDLFIGDGGLLSNIATTLDQIVDQGNTVSNTLFFESGQDATSNTGIVTHKDVGISISNTEPTGEFQFGVGSNLLVNVYSSNVLAIEGNVSAEKMTLGTISVTSAYGLNHVTAQGSVTGDTISLTNATTGLEVTSNLTAGGNVTAETVITSANVEVGNRLKFASNVFVDDLRVADLAANLVTYDKTTGELMDSGGLFANKLAVVSVQPPSALSANTTTIAKHGTYTVTTSSLAANSNAWNVFDGAAVDWLASTTSDHVYNGGGYTYGGTSNLFAGNYIQSGVSSAGEWLAIEFPYKTTLRHMKLTPPATYQQYPASANVYATNDSLTWTEVVNWSGVNPYTSSNVQTITVNATEAYKKYAMVVTKTNGSDTNTGLAKWQLFTESFSIDGGKVAMASSAVMGGETTVDQSGPHSRLPKTVPLKKYPEIVFESGKFDGSRTSTDATYDEQYYLQAGTTVKVVSETTSRVAHQAFNGDIVGANGNGWHTQFGFDRNTGLYDTSNNRGDTFTDTNGDPHLGMWIQTKFPNKIKVKNINLYIGNNVYRYPKSLVVLGHSSLSSLTGWTLLHTETDISTTTPALGDTTPTVLNVNADTAFDCYTILVKSARPEGVAGQQSIWVSEIEYYGYEELATQGDTSVDTTFTSIMNTPQTTGANVYVDGNLGETFTNRVTGPDATGTATTYNETGKYWELTGALTSNVSLEANTFLEGDQPHAVSVWFNSSNLEANVSNTCVFSISDQEKLDSVNLDLQSNTWHNLTYAYQGEGGSRVTYLDGRKVAEDQAEDTFGEYPPFAMTGYSQGGYVVSASAEHSSGFYPPWKLFDNNLTSADDSYETDGGRYDTTGAPYEHTAGVSTIVSGTPYTGDWVQVEFPFKFKVDQIDLLPQDTYGLERMPQTAIIAGSDDNTNWALLKSITTDVHALTVFTNYTVSATRAYKYIRFIWNTLTTAGSNAAYRGRIAGQGMRFYGHRENDLVRLPDPTRVLKYPHIAMTGPAQRGYVASASTEYPGTTYPVWKAFNQDNSAYNMGWLSQNVANLYNPTYNTGVASSRLHSSTPYGEYVILTLPHKLLMTKISIVARNTGSPEVPRSFKIYGSDTGTSWNEVLDVVDNTNINTSTFTTIDADTSTTAYNQFAIVITKTAGTTSYVGLGDLEFYGTGVDSIPIQIGGGNIDKVANFRVYDKFVGEDQALEIWDAQKDTFRGVKNSATLHKGRLGIGTTEPEGRLAVLDEPNGLEEFPPRAMSDDKTYIEGHGVFRASASSNIGGWRPWAAFNHIVGNEGYHSGSGDSYTNGTYDGTNSLGGYSGAWISLELPYKIRIDTFKIATRVGWPHRGPVTGVLLASNDNVHWDKLHDWSSVTFTDYQYTNFKVNNTDKYSHFAIVATALDLSNSNANSLQISEWRLFGTREQGQSVLHDGQLTLTKNLNVPRIGPALDADDTPRRDRLVVEYNTSTNPTFEGAVRDTSGRGLDAILRDATYDATDKSIRVGTSQDIFLAQGIPGKSGDVTNVSYSIWFNADNVTDANQIIMSQISAYAVGVGLTLALNTNELQLGFGYAYSSGQQIGGAVLNAISAGQWYHVVAIKKGSGTLNATTLPDILEIYINGEKKTLSHGGGTGTLNVGTDHWLIIGSIQDTHSTAEEFKGNVSSIKYYDTVLTASEVKTLYDMGRCDEGHHVVNFSKTRVGIGLGDGEAPRADLDVRGEIHATKSLNPVAGMWKVTVDSSTVTTTIIKDIGSCMSTRAADGYGGYTGFTGSVGIFVAPYDGVYQFQCFLTGQSTSSNLLLVFNANGPSVTNGTWSSRNLIGEYGEIIDLRLVTNIEESHNFATLLDMSKGDYVDVQLHSASYLGSGHVRCSCFLAHRY